MFQARRWFAKCETQCGGMLVMRRVEAANDCSNRDKRETWPDQQLETAVCSVPRVLAASFVHLLFAQERILETKGVTLGARLSPKKFLHAHV